MRRPSLPLAAASTATALSPHPDWERPLRLVLANLCEDAMGYGPGASEYLRAQIITSPELAARVDVSIVFEPGMSEEQAVERILARDPDAVGLTAYSWNLALNLAVARRLRARAPDVLIVWGGCSFGLFHERSDWFKGWDAADAVASGSGEYTLLDLLGYLLERPRPCRLEHALRGLVVNRAGTLEYGERARYPERLDDLASPYLQGVVHRVQHPFIEMARGCTYQCSFCSDARKSREGRFEFHSAERLAREIAVIAAWPGSEAIDAGASTANIDEEAFGVVCDAIRNGDPKKKLKFSFQLYPSLVRASHRAAFESLRVSKLCVGVQSTAPGTFKAMQRKTTVEQVRQVVERIGGSAPLLFSLILGIPGETVESFKETLDALVLDLGVNVVVHRLLVLPGTQLHAAHERWDLRFREDCFYRATSTFSMSEGDLRRAQDYVLEVAQRLPKAPTRDGLLRLDWTNFDVQELAFTRATRDAAPP